MNILRIFVFNLIIGIATFMSAPNSYAGETMTPPQALQQVEAGKMVLLDIRTPNEWKETGIASVATPLTMHDRNFLSGFQKVVQDNPGKKIGVICATGGRSEWLQAELAKRGLTPVVNVGEGMLGNKTGPGWIARKLGMKKVQ